MASNEGISENDFNTLKTVVSRWYDDHKCINMLKVLFRDSVDKKKLSEKTDTMELLNELVDTDDLSLEDPTLLYETIKITKQFGIKHKIKKELPSFPDVRKRAIEKITNHRQNLMKFGMAMTTGDVKKIDGLFNTPLKYYEDSWKMIIDLEDEKKIRENDMNEFIKSLQTLGLHFAVDTLVEVCQDIPGGPKEKKRRLITDPRQNTNPHVLLPIPSTAPTPSLTNPDIPHRPTSSDTPNTEQPDRMPANLTTTTDKEDIPHRPTSSDTTNTEQPDRMPANLTTTTEGSSDRDPDMEFQTMLIEVSTWYKKNGVTNRLKVLYKDIVKIHDDLKSATSPMDLFKLLIVPGHLKPTDFKVLIDTIKVTDTRGVLDVNNLLRSAYVDTGITAFSDHRQKIMQLGNALSAGDARKLGDLYSEARSDYKDQWTLILNLEKREVISEKKMKSFIKGLKGIGLSHAASKLE